MMFFVSANMKYPNDLFQARHALSPPGIYAYGKNLSYGV